MQYAEYGIQYAEYVIQYAEYAIKYVKQYTKYAKKYVKPFAICGIVTCSDFAYSAYVCTPHFADDSGAAPAARRPAPRDPSAKWAVCKICKTYAHVNILHMENGFTYYFAYCHYYYAYYFAYFIHWQVAYSA
jgi:hypothetical protein